MRVTIEIMAAKYQEPRKADIVPNMEALHRAIHAVPPTSPADVLLLVDTLSILEGIYQKLPD